MFALKDPEIWVRALRDFPGRESDIRSKDFKPGTAGAMIKDVIAEVEKRSKAENVMKFEKHPKAWGVAPPP